VNLDLAVLAGQHIPATPQFSHGLFKDLLSERLATKDLNK
jgi:hypothetical protein